MRYSRKIKIITTQFVYIAFMTSCTSGLNDAEPDFTPPQVRINSPIASVSIVRTSQMVRADAVDENGISKVEFYIADSLLFVDSNAPWQYVWNTTDFSDGDYILTAKAFDAAGNVGLDSVIVKLRSLIMIKEIMVVDEFDETGLLEIEVHLFASGGVFRGCSGPLSGMEGVDASDAFYFVNAFFQKSNGGTLHYDEIKDRRVYLEVIEDDTGPCPMAPNYNAGLNRDDLLGKSPSFLGSQVEQPLVMDFGKVAHIRIEKGRRK